MNVPQKPGIREESLEASFPACIPILGTVHAALRPLSSDLTCLPALLCGPELAGHGAWGQPLFLLCLPSCFRVSFSLSASWTAIEHSLLKLGETLASLSSPQLRSQAEQCGTLIRR